MILIQMDNQQEHQRSNKSEDPCDKVAEIYKATKKKLLEANRSYPYELNQEKIQAEAEIQYNSFLEQYGQLVNGDKENEQNSSNMHSSQLSKWAHEDQYRCYMKKVKSQFNKQNLHLPTLKDSLFRHDIFMKEHKINFAKARRLQKQVSNLVLLNFFQLKAMPIPEQIQQEDQQLKQELNKFYGEEIEKVKAYFPEDYEHILALSTATGRMTIKKRKKKDDH